MPAKNVVKTYVEDGYYHIYNRGVEKRVIFSDTRDYSVFLSFLKSYLSPPPDPKLLLKDFTLKGGTFKGIPRQTRNFNKEIALIAYCLMPNHFHFLVRQKSATSIGEFMRSVFTRYTMHFNKRHQRVGALFQGAYKAVLITDESYLLHLTRYIHLNPLEHVKSLLNAFSSYADYLGLRKTRWLNTRLILEFFKAGSLIGLRHVNSYQSFVENQEINSVELLGDLTLES